MAPFSLQSSCLQQKNRPHELKKQQKRSIAISTSKMTAITMPARAPFPIAFTASTEVVSVNEIKGRHSEGLTNQKSDKCRSQ